MQKRPLKVRKVAIAEEIPLEERKKALWQCFDILLSQNQKQQKTYFKKNGTR